MVMLPGQVLAAPTSFPHVIGNALLCLDQVDSTYFKKYLTDNFQTPYKIEGGAYWFKIDSFLYGGKITEIFINTESSEYVFLGAVMEGPQDSLKIKIEELTGIKFFQDQNIETLRSPPGSFLIPYGSGKSKIFCVKRRIYGMSTNNKMRIT
ncbi:hypothetical protein [Sulfurirhabdus autotrophica]|uniref:Uncharacterized protein n=2 Tax=Sulfurirhabdus autotrophica TaxID=1706046 RepID=A0A4R3Y4M1_9PROT|nr:hypothetical protein [Sulfurirhabdus autotrophica]TCV86700.1 hypothetical protein EDC63_10661 [Sulfurirhabdus autotrophica]